MAERGKVEGQKSNVESKKNELEKELVENALRRFERNLARMREVAEIKTICMHGSPLSPWDSRLMWRYADYRDYGILGEPYFDLDFSETLYLTDTGRRWDGDRVNIRDRALVNDGSFKVPVRTPIDRPLLSTLYRFHSTAEIIAAAARNQLPDRMMLTFHPQRWTVQTLPWLRELVWQSVKNGIKRIKRI